MRINQIDTELDTLTKGFSLSMPLNMAAMKRFKQLRFEKAFLTRDIQLAMNCDSTDVAGNIVKMASVITDEELHTLLSEQWSRCEAHRPFRKELVALFRRARKIGLVTDAKKPLRSSLRKIYRGNLGEDEPSGLCWTLSKEKAIWFAKSCTSMRAKIILGYPKGTPTLWSAKVDTKDMLGYFVGRNESEIVADPAMLMDVKRLKIKP